MVSINGQRSINFSIGIVSFQKDNREEADRYIHCMICHNLFCYRIYKRSSPFYFT